MTQQNDQQSLRIFSIISQIEQTLEACQRPKIGGGGNRRVVDIDQIFDLLGDLKVTIPEDIRRANSILIEADTILGHANEEACELIQRTQQETANLRQQTQEEVEQLHQAAIQEYEASVAESAVLTEAKRRADLLQQHAEHNASVVYNGAKQYADEILQDVQRYLLEYHAMVTRNRTELGVTYSRKPAEQPQEPAAAAQAQPEAAPAASVSPAAPVEPVRSQPVNAPAPEEDEEPIPESKPKRRGLFSRKPKDDLFDDDDFLEDDDEEEEAPPKRKRGKKSREEDLDIDLDE
ncbi:MAG: hypothetical protein PHO41_01735 [Eubacteriales bacterium]|nr:hypothetical protein [Eubacteriales bacterium]